MKFELDNVELSFSEKRILYGVYIKAEKGRVTGILGSNGCGKTSLLKIFFGNLDCNNKLVRINGKGTLKPLYTRANVKYLSQEDFFPGNIKVEKLFNFHRADWEQFATTFPSFKDYHSFLYKKLSGGERRLLATWLIIKSDAALILLDEPFTHLAPLYIEKIKSIIIAEKANKAILLTDHLYRHLLDISDEIYFLKEGSTRQIKSEKELAKLGYIKP